MRKTHKYGLFFRALAMLAALSSLALVCPPALAAQADIYKRNESVYVDLDADGSVLSMVSSVYLTNTDKAAELEDKTTLTDIKNVLGKQKPRIEGERVIFPADGDDVCYQGTAHGEPPVSVEISYTLDGKPIGAEELRGRSGRLCLHIKTVNHDKHSVMVEDAPVELCTPFSVLCILALNDGFSMIQCDNGRVRSEAGSVNVMAILHPGLKESLGLTDTEQIHDELRLWANVENFSLDSISFVVMTGIVDEENLSGIDDVQALLDGIDELADATDELYDGASDMYEGTSEYADGLREFKDGLQEYREGLEKYAGGITELYFGIGELNNGAGKLTQGAWKLNSGVKELQQGIAQGMTDSSGAMQFAKAATQTINLYVFGNTMTEMQIKNIESVLNNAYQSANKAQMMQLASALSELAKGTSEYAGGVAEYSAGVSKLENGALEIIGATGELRDGVIDLQEGAQELHEGAAEIADGVLEFMDGIGEFRDEGIKEMQEETADVRVSLGRKGAILALSDAYTSFSASDPSASGTVQFIMTTPELISEKPITNANVASSENAQGSIEAMKNKEDQPWWVKLWESVKGWFGK